MKIDIYTSTINGAKYLSVKAGLKLESLVFESTIDPDMLNLSPFRTRLEIDASKPHKALDAKDIQKQIESNGYALHSAKTAIKISTKAKSAAKTKTAKPSNSKANKTRNKKS